MWGEIYFEHTTCVLNDMFEIPNAYLVLNLNLLTVLAMLVRRMIGILARLFSRSHQFCAWGHNINFIKQYEESVSHTEMALILNRGKMRVYFF